MSARAPLVAKPAASAPARGAAPLRGLSTRIQAVLGTAGTPLSPTLRALIAGQFGGDLSGIPARLRGAPSRVVAGHDPGERTADQAAERAASTSPGEAALVASRFGALANVRVHTGSLAAAAASALRAKAFTLDNHLVFGAGAWRPEIASGRALIAHELAHAATPGPAGSVWRKPLADGSADAEIADPTDQAQLAAEANKPTESPSEPDAVANGGPVAPATAGLAPPAPVAAATAAPGSEPKAAATIAPQPVAGVAEMATGDLGLIDEELAEHERWGEAAAEVGQAGSEERAGFIAHEAAGGALKGAKEGIKGGVESTIKMKVAEKIVEKAAIATAVRFGAKAGVFKSVPGVGAVIGGALAAYELAHRDWGKTGDAIAGFGKGADIYDQLANTIESISTVLEVATQVANVIAGILGVIVVVSWIAAVASGGVLGPLATLLSTIAIKIGLVSLVIDAINALVLKELITTFRSLHAFASEADPRDVVAQGAAIEQAAGGATGFATGVAAGVAADKGLHFGAAKIAPKLPGHPLPAAAGGEGPHVTAKPPPEGGPPPAIVEATPPAATAAPEPPPLPAPVEAPTEVTAKPAPKVAEPPAAAAAKPAAAPALEAATPAPAPETPSAAAPKEAPTPEQLTLPGVDLAPSGGQPPPAAPPPAASNPVRTDLKPITPILELQGLTGNEPVPQGLEPGAIGTYAVAVDQPHSFALESQPPGAPGATRVGGRLPQEGRAAAGVYAEHLSPAAAMHEVLPGHELHGPQGQRRGGRDTKEWLATSTPEAAKPFKDRADNRLLADVQRRKAAGESVPPIEVAVRGVQNYQDAIAQSGANVPGHQVTKGFLGEVDQVHDPRFGFEEYIPGSPNAEASSLAGVSAAEFDAHLDRQFDPHIADAPKLARPAVPGGPQLELPFPAAAGGVPPAADVPSSIGPRVTEAASAQPETEPPRIRVATPPEAEPPRFRVAAPQDPAEAPRVRVATPEAEAAELDAPEVAAGSAAPRFRRMTLPIPGGSGPRPDTGAAPPELKSDAPITERVNPAYQPPPATPDQINSLRNQVIDTLAARANAVTFAGLMGQQEKHHAANEKPLAGMAAKTGEAIAATSAHQAAIAHREAANKRKTAEEAKARTKLDDYDCRSRELVAIKWPLKGVQKFTGLAAELPDDPGTVASFKRGMLKMNVDASKFIGKLDDVDKTIASQKADHQARQEAATADAATIGRTKDKAGASGEQLDSAKVATAEVDGANKDGLDQAKTEKQGANQTAAALDLQAKQKQSQADGLAAALKFWAEGHRKARVATVEQTRKRLESQGWRVTGVSGV